MPSSDHIRQLIEQMAPAFGAIAAGGDGHGAAFWQGYQQQTAQHQQERQRLAQENERKQLAGSQFMIHSAEQLQGIDDPVQFAEMRDLLELAGHKAGYIQPGDLKSRVSFPESKTSALRLKELEDQLATLEKNSYDVDQLAESGGRLKLKDGTTVPIATALEMTRRRPVDASGKPVAKPKKATPLTGTEDERAAALQAQLRTAAGKGDIGGAFQANAGYTDLIKAKGDLATAGRAPVKPETPVDPVDTATKKARLDLLLTQLKKANALASDTVDPLVQAVIDNPSIMDRLTPSAISKIAPALNKAGFDAFGKPLAESAITKLSETRAAIQSLKDLRETLGKNERFIGPVAGLAAMNPYSEARKAQADIDRVKQRVGKALEGGVLRKEDEDKYKRILATLRDTPSTAIYKVDQIIQSLENDLKTFEDEQKRAGRRVTPPAGASAGVEVWERDATGKLVKKAAK